MTAKVVQIDDAKSVAAATTEASLRCVILMSHSVDYASEAAGAKAGWLALPTLFKSKLSATL